MADHDDAEDAVLDAITTLAKQAKSATNHTVALKWASAANQLAEALAWLNNPSQPHGGSSFGES